MMQVMLGAVCVAWLLLVILPVFFPKTLVVPESKLTSVTLVLTTIMGILAAGGAFKSKNGKE